MLSSRLRSSRKSCGLTQTALAKSVGLSQSHVAQMESGDRTPSLDVLQALARALLVTPAYLLGQDDAPAAGVYLSDPRESVSADPMVPPGLRALAQDEALSEVIRIKPVEWAALRSLVVPEPPGKDGYIAILYALRATCRC